MKKVNLMNNTILNRIAASLAMLIVSLNHFNHVVNSTGIFAPNYNWIDIIIGAIWVLWAIQIAFKGTDNG